VFPIKDNIPTDSFPIVTIVLIAINVVVFLFWQHPTGFNSVDNTKVVEYGAIPYELTHPGKHCALVSGLVACEGQPGVAGTAPGQPVTILTVFTSMFMHGGILHIVGNMLFLWIFGNNVEDSMGRPRFVAFYLLGGIAALLGQVVIDPNATVPTIGASGAIAAVLGGYLLLYPQARVLTIIFIVFFFTILELPALAILGFWFVQQILFGYFDLSDPTGGGGGGVAYFAHIGGFAFGLLAIRVFAHRRRALAGRPFART
jgi:membrane associated rhomboid family serine protease